MLQHKFIVVAYWSHPRKGEWVIPYSFVCPPLFPSLRYKPLKYVFSQTGWVVKTLKYEIKFLNVSFIQYIGYLCVH